MLQHLPALSRCSSRRRPRARAARASFTRSARSSARAGRDPSDPSGAADGPSQVRPPQLHQVVQSKLLPHLIESGMVSTAFVTRDGLEVRLGSAPSGGCRSRRARASTLTARHSPAGQRTSVLQPSGHTTKCRIAAVSALVSDADWEAKRLRSLFWLGSSAADSHRSAI
jgi:hypothetical protein